MRHRVYGKHLGRDKNQRSALFKGLVRSLIIHESITTTEAKAKAIKGLVDTLVSKAKKKEASAKQFIQGFLPDKEVGKKLVGEVASRYPNRVSGFTGMVRLGRRLGDGAMMVKMSFVEGEIKKVSQGERVSQVSQGEEIKTNPRGTRGTSKSRGTLTKKTVKEKK